MIGIRLAILLILLATAIGPARAGDAAVFHGEVQRGDTVVHLFTLRDTELEFRLVPLEDGWELWIGDPAARDRNYVTVATPPFRGINPSVIQGWHFRNSDNTGPNAPGAKAVNAPGLVRDFALILNPADFQAASEALEIVLQPTDRPAAELRAAEAKLAALPVARGKLTVGALELGNLVAGQHATIDRMAFSVHIEAQ